jgi:hypothetical protein
VIVPAGFVFSNIIVGVIVVAALYFAREILVPIALAVLLSSGTLGKASAAAQSATILSGNRSCSHCARGVVELDHDGDG